MELENCRKESYVARSLIRISESSAYVVLRNESCIVSGRIAFFNIVRWQWQEVEILLQIDLTVHRKSPSSHHAYLSRLELLKDKHMHILNTPSLISLNILGIKYFLKIETCIGCFGRQIALTFLEKVKGFSNSTNAISLLYKN